MISADSTYTPTGTEDLLSFSLKKAANKVSQKVTKKVNSIKKEATSNIKGLQGTASNIQKGGIRGLKSEIKTGIDKGADQTRAGIKGKVAGVIVNTNPLTYYGKVKRHVTGKQKIKGWADLDPVQKADYRAFGTGLLDGIQVAGIVATGGASGAAAGAGKAALKQGIKVGVKQGAKQGAKMGLKSLGKSFGKKAAKKIATKAGSKAIAKKVGKKIATKVGEKAAEKLAPKITGKLVGRLQNSKSGLIRGLGNTLAPKADTQASTEDEIPNASGGENTNINAGGAEQMSSPEANEKVMVGENTQDPTPKNKKKKNNMLYAFVGIALLVVVVLFAKK